MGYNGAPIGFSDDIFPWGREGGFLDTKYAYVCHAEMNAILNCPTSLKDSRCYVTLFPCNECAKAIVQSGIKEIIYLNDKYHDTADTKASRKMFNTTHTEFVQFKPSYEKMSNVINSIMILGNSPKYRNIANSSNIEQDVEDWYNDIINCIR